MTTGSDGGRRYVGAVHLRVADLNFFGHLDNVSTLRMVDEARTHFLGFRGTHDDHYTGGLMAAAGPGVQFFIAQQSIEYLGELWFDQTEPAELTMWVSHVGGASVVLPCEIRQRAGAEVAARAETSVVLVDVETRRPWRIPADLRARFEEYLGPPAKLRPRRT